MLHRVEVAKGKVRVRLDPVALRDALADLDDRLADLALADEPLAIEVAASSLRCGREVRLVVGDVRTTTGSVKPEPALVDLVRSGHRWFEDLRTGKAPSIAAVATRDRQQVSHVSRNLSLAFLAPDITAMILAGRQPATLTPERLKAARPLPLDWREQRAMLLR